MVKSEKQRRHLERLNQSQEHRQKVGESIKKRGRKNHPAWKGGIRKGGKKFGYLRESCPSHPYSDKQGYVLQHRLVMEKHIGRVLLPEEVVHHINNNRQDNRIENLMLFANVSKHWEIAHPSKKYYCIDCNRIVSAKAKRCQDCYFKWRFPKCDGRT